MNSGAEIGAELVLVFRLGEVAEHVGGRSEKDEPAAFVEQDRLVKHLEKFRARLVDRDDDDLVMGEGADDLDDVLGIFRRQTGRGLVEEVNVRRPNHIKADVEPFPFAAAQRFFHRAADDAVAPFV